MFSQIKFCALFATTCSSWTLEIIEQSLFSETNDGCDNVVHVIGPLWCWPLFCVFGIIFGVLQDIFEVQQQERIFGEDSSVDQLVELCCEFAP